MMLTPRERVKKALEFDCPDRAPRDVWPLATISDPVKRKLFARFPMDIESPGFVRPASNAQKKSTLPRQPRISSHGSELLTKGCRYIDEWGSVWRVTQDGMLGEVQEPAVRSIEEIKAYVAPWEVLEAMDLSDVNEFCERSNRYVLSDYVANPFERIQFIRGTVNLFRDWALERTQVLRLLDIIHEYNLEYLKLWANTEVDGISIGDDWGSEKKMLISPSSWRDVLKPLYIEYCKLIHSYGKSVFCHADGWIEDVFPDLIEMKINAINSQLFAMNIGRLGQLYKGKITFWGEADRRILYFGSPQEIRNSIYRVRRALDDGRGGLIAQCVWETGVPFDHVEAMYEAWDKPLAEVFRGQEDS